MIKERQHYTQLSLISQFMENYLTKNHYVSIGKLKLNKFDEQHFVIEFQKRDAQSINTIYKFKLKAIQMGKIIKIFILLFVKHQSQPQNKSNNFQIQKYECLDSFWFSYQNHLKSKHNNMYRQKCIKQSLSNIISARIQKYCFIDNKNLFIKAITTQNNIYKICSFLNKKQLLALESINSFINKMMSSNKFYIRLYESNWGKTGFQQNQINWKKTYHQKTIKNIK